VACAGRADAGRAATGEATPGPGAAPEPGDPAHTAEGVRAHGLAGGVGFLLRVAAQGAVDAGEAVSRVRRRQDGMQLSDGLWWSRVRIGCRRPGC